MTDNRAGRGGLAAAAAIALLLPAAAVAADVVPLRHGSYVQADTPCAEASNATIRTFTGHGFESASSGQCTARRIARTGNRYTVRQQCTEYKVAPGAPQNRVGETRSIERLSPTRFAEGGTAFRLCPGVR